MGFQFVNRAVLLAAAFIPVLQQAYASELPLPVNAGRSPAMSAAPVEEGLAVPAYSSNPGAPYTLYLNFGGFTYNGTWAGGTPGTTPAYTTDGDASTFTTTELNNIHNIWSRVAQKYLPFNVNVTTVDPAVAAGTAGSDASRQTYYDSVPRFMHTVIGGSGGWIGGGGISYVGVTAGSYNNNAGYHTNWVFSAQGPTQLQFVAEATAHEDGHGLALSHQSDYTGTTKNNEYSDGTGALSPIMGVSYYSSRAGLWSKGTVPSGSSVVIQNDAHTLVNQSGMGGYKNTGVGHTLSTATHLPMTGNTVNYASAKGVIVPTATSNPQPLGAANYTQDHWSFVTLGGVTTLTVNSGIATYGNSTPDAGAMLDATLALYKSDGTLLQTLDTSALSESLTINLAPGLYNVAVLSHGGASDLTYTQRDFFDMGAYFITGSIRQPLAGDADLNNLVDFNDFLALQNNFNQSGKNFMQGDFNFNGIVDFNDFLLLQNNFGGTAPGLTPDQVAAITAFGLANVPEPAFATLAGAGLLLARRRRR